MKFVNDRQRRAVFSRLNRDSPDNKFCIGLYILSDLALKEKEKLEKHYESGRKNKFALYLSKDGYIRSSIYPNVNVEYMVESDDLTKKSAKEISDALDLLDESHLAGLDVLDVIPGSKKDLGNALGKQGISSEGKKFVMVMNPSDMPIEYTGFTSYVVPHEVGHHVADTLGKKYIKNIGESGREILAEIYTGNPDAYDDATDDDLKSSMDIMSYAETLQELKTPSVKELTGYASKFSIDHAGYKKAIENLENDYWENKMTKAEYDAKLAAINKQFLGLNGDNKFSFADRKRKGWYPEGTNLPSEFPDIVRRVAMDIIIKDNNYITPEDDVQVSRLTGEVCRELDKIWKPKWGARPSGHYLKADVKDAFEDLD